MFCLDYAFGFAAHYALLTRYPLDSSPLGALFAGTAAENRPGMLRAYTFPLSGEYLEYACMGSAITRMRITYDDQVSRQLNRKIDYLLKIK